MRRGAVLSSEGGGGDQILKTHRSCEKREMSILMAVDFLVQSDRVRARRLRGRNLPVIFFIIFLFSVRRAATLLTAVRRL